MDSLTCSPDSTFLASFTLPMLPAPIVFPSAHCPVFGALIFVLRLVWVGCAPDRAVSVATPLMGMAEAVDASEAYRVCPLLLGSEREGAGAALSLDSLRRVAGELATLGCSKSRRATFVRLPCWGDGRAWEWVVERVVVDWERCGRSGVPLTGCGRREELERTTAGVVGAVADMVVRLLRKEQLGACEESDAMSAVGERGARPRQSSEMRADQGGRSSAAAMGIETKGARSAGCWRGRFPLGAVESWSWPARSIQRCMTEDGASGRASGAAARRAPEHQRTAASRQTAAGQSM